MGLKYMANWKCLKFSTTDFRHDAAHINTHTHTHTHIHKHIYTHTHTRTHTYIHTYMHTYTERVYNSYHIANLKLSRHKYTNF